MEVEVKAIYRHFKGKDYMVEAVANDCETTEKVVVYRQLYGDTTKLWVRKLSDFVAILPERKDNITGQIHRFELVK